MASLFPTPSPTLPDFESILIHGEYHTSAPLHLILSHCARNPKSRAVLITPSRQRFKEALQHFNDEWLRAQGCYMSTSIISERVKILYPSTPAHLILLLTLFHESQPAYKSFFTTKATFDVTPTLLVLCDISLYLLDNTEATTSSYLSLISHALSSVASLSANSLQPVALSVFDSALTELKLPLLRPIIEEDPVKPEDDIEIPLEFVASLAQKYFDWVGAFEEVDVNADEMETDFVRRCKLRLSANEAEQDSDEGGSEPQEIIWEWTECRQEGRGTTFHFSM